MNKQITLEVRENTQLSRFGQQPHGFSKWGVYQIVTQNNKEISSSMVCLIPDWHIDPESTARGIIKALNKAGIMPTTYEVL